MSIYPAWFRCVKNIIRPWCKKLEVRGEENLRAPTVFITRHLNNYGPVAVYLFTPVEFHMWTYYVFMDAKAYYKHSSEYTFTKRLHLPMWASRALAWCMAKPVVYLYKSLGMIPVYRGLRTVFKTMDLSVDELEKGENVLIMADVDYSSTDAELKEIYTGFIHLGKLYYKRTGKNLNFTTLSINSENAYLRVGKPIEFDSTVPYQQERDRIANKIREELYDNY